MAKPKTKTASQAKDEYARRNYDSYLLKMPKSMLAQLKACAAEQGISVNRYILEAVEQRSGLKLTLDNALPWMNSESKN